MEVLIFIDNTTTPTPYRIVTAPVLIPDVPDCDYKKGETPLTVDQIQHLQVSYKNYQIIDYDHQFCLNGDWYMKKIGTPLKSWISTKSTSYTDITGTTREIPAGTWWLKSKITNPIAIKMIDDGKLTAYSLTTANQIYADKIIDLLNNGQSQSNKSQDTELNKLAAKSRTLIKDIDNPVGFTVSLTNFPCVSNAVFAQQCLFESQTNTKNNNGENNMTENEKTTTKYTIDDIKSIFNLFSKKADDTKEGEGTTKKEDNTNKEEDNRSKYATKDDITKINNRIDELSTKIDELQKKGKKEEGEDNKTSKTQKEDTSKASSEKNETTANKNIKSKEIPHTHDGINNQSYKHNINPEAQLMTSLGRDQYGISKFKQNKNIIKGDE